MEFQVRNSTRFTWYIPAWRYHISSSQSLGHQPKNSNKQIQLFFLIHLHTSNHLCYLHIHVSIWSCLDIKVLWFLKWLVNLNYLSNRYISFVNSSPTRHVYTLYNPLSSKLSVTCRVSGWKKRIQFPPQIKLTVTIYITMYICNSTRVFFNFRFDRSKTTRRQWWVYYIFRISWFFWSTEISNT